MLVVKKLFGWVDGIHRCVCVCDKFVSVHDTQRGFLPCLKSTRVANMANVPEEQTTLRKSLSRLHGKPRGGSCTAGDSTCSLLIIIVEGGSCTVDARVRARGEMYNFADVNSNTSENAIGVRGLGCSCNKEIHYTTDLTFLPVADGGIQTNQFLFQEKITSAGDFLALQLG